MDEHSLVWRLSFWIPIINQIWGERVLVNYFAEKRVLQSCKDQSCHVLRRRLGGFVGQTMRIRKTCIAQFQIRSFLVHATDKLHHVHPRNCLVIWIQFQVLFEYVAACPTVFNKQKSSKILSEHKRGIVSRWKHQANEEIINWIPKPCPEMSCGSMNPYSEWAGPEVDLLGVDVCCLHVSVENLTAHVSSHDLCHWGDLKLLIDILAEDIRHAFHVKHVPRFCRGLRRHICVVCWIFLVNVKLNFVHRAWVLFQDWVAVRLDLLEGL